TSFSNCAYLSIVFGIKNLPVLSNSTWVFPLKKLRCNFRYSSLNSFKPAIFWYIFLYSNKGYITRQGSNPLLITNSLAELSGKLDLILEGKTSLPSASNLHSYSLVKNDIFRLS